MSEPTPGWRPFLGSVWTTEPPTIHQPPMTNPAEGVSLDQITAAMHALGFDLTAADLCSVEIKPGRIVIEGGIRHRDRLLVSYSSQTDPGRWRMEIPVIDNPRPPKPDPRQPPQDSPVAGSTL